MKNTRKERLPWINTVRIMGVDIADLNMDMLMDLTKRHLSDMSGTYITVSNVHTTVTAYEEEDYRVKQNGAFLANPDGTPLTWVGRQRGGASIGRTTGPSYMGEVFAVSREKGYTHYFYGSTQETLDKLKDALEKAYPGLSIAGMYSPPFRALSEDEDSEITAMIAEADADFIWVGLGAPKQERWMAAHEGMFRGVMVGVGAGFDYFADNIKRAPQWMQKCGLEWFYRLIQDPKRLFKRYLVTNSKFIWNAMIRGR